MTIAREYDFTVTGGGKLEPFGYQWKPQNVIDAYDLGPEGGEGCSRAPNQRNPDLRSTGADGNRR